MEQDQFFGSPFALRILDPHTGLILRAAADDKKESESQGVKRCYCTGVGEQRSRAGRMLSVSLAVPLEAILPGFAGRKSFWNSRSHGPKRPWCLGQFPLSSPAKPRWIPRSSGDARSIRGHSPLIMRREEKKEDRSMRAQYTWTGQPEKVEGPYFVAHAEFAMRRMV